MDDDARLDSRPWLLALVDTAEEAVVSITLDARIVSWNAAAETLCGYRAQEVLGTSLSLLALPERSEELGELLRRVAGGGRVERHRTVLRGRCGDRLDVSVSLSPMRAANGEVVGAALVARDLAIERARTEARRQARKLEELGRLAAGVAHDFNNLLTAILGFGSLALEDTSGAAREAVEEIVGAAARASDLTRQLLVCTRRASRPPERVDLDTVVASLVALLRRLLGEEVELAVAPAGQPLPFVELDPTHAEQVLVNLIVNARDAMPHGGRVTVSTSVVDLEPPAAVRTGRYVALSVTDEGVGMDEETRRRLFEPFFTTKEAGRGTGLGLATVHDIVANAGGHIAVTSSTGSGAAFTVYLPVAEERARRGHDAHPQTIMVVEDDEQLLRLVRTMLEREGYRVVGARRAQEALDAGRAAPAVDLIVADVVMPGMTGPELVRRLAASGRAVPAIFMSGHPADADARVSSLELAHCVLDKPFSAELLLEHVRAALERRESRAA